MMIAYLGSMKNRGTPRATPSIARAIVIFALAAASSASAQDAAEPTYSLDGTDLVVDAGGEQTRLALGCQGSSLLVEGARVYIACGRAGAVVVEMGAEGATVIDRLGGAGEITGFFVQGDRVWATSTRTEARPIDDLPIATSGALAASTSAAPTRLPEPQDASVAAAIDAGQVGEVLEVSPQSAVVSLGMEDGLTVGSRVEVFEVRLESLGGEVQARAEERLVVAVVTAVGEGRSRIALGMNERVPVGAAARVVDSRLTRSRVNPPRVGGFFELGMSIRPFIPLNDDLGLGIMGDLSLVYRGEGPWFVSTAITPFGISLTKGSDQSVVGWNVAAGYDHRLVQLGVGVGLLRFTEYDYYSSSTDLEPVVGMTFSQNVRFGALDGLHFGAVSQILLLEETMYEPRRFEWSGMTAHFQIPVYNYTWLVVQGGGSYGGEAWGEIGLKLTLRGDGSPGTVFLTPSIGAAALTQGDSIVGPMVGLSVDWRI